MKSISTAFKLEVEFPISLLTSNTERVFLSIDSDGLEIKYNNELIVQDNERLCLVEEFHQSIKDLLVEFKSVNIEVFNLSQLKMNLIGYFPVIRVISTSLCVEIKFVWLQKVKSETEYVDELKVNSESFLLDFSKKFCVQSITFYLSNTELEFLLLLALNKEVLENGNYVLTLDYKFDPFGINFAKKEKGIISLDFYSIVTNQLNVETVVDSYVLGDSTSLGKNYLFLGKVVEKENIPTLSQSIKKIKLVSKFYKFADKLLKLRILYKQVKTLEYPKTVNKVIEKIRNLITNSVPNLYLFAYDCYYSLSEEV